MGIRVAVVDDDPAFCRTEANLIRSCGQEHGETIEVDLFNSSAMFLQKFTAQYDIVVSDVVMHDYSGIEVAQRIRLFDPNCLILFVASSPKFAINGYQVNAFSYLLKPLSATEFNAEFSKALRTVLHRERPTILLHEESSYYRVPLRSISYIESAHHRITVHSDEKDIAVTTTLSALQERLEPYGFYRINSYYLVNMSRVRAIDSKICVLDTGAKLAISRSRKEKFVEAFLRQQSLLTPPWHMAFSPLQRFLRACSRVMARGGLPFGLPIAPVFKPNSIRRLMTDLAF